MSDFLDATGDSVERRLRAALASRAEHVDRMTSVPPPVPRAVAMRPPLLRRRPAAVAGIAVAAAVALLFGVIALGADDDRGQDVIADGDPTTTTTASPTTSTPSDSSVVTSIAPPSSSVQSTVAPGASTTVGPSTKPTTAAASTDKSITGWPARGSTSYSTGRSAAGAFVKRVLGFSEPTFRRATSEDVPVGGTATVTYSPRPTAGSETTVTVVRNGEKSWLVQGATSNQGSISKAVFSERRIEVAGTGTAFEATITIRALSLFGTKLGEDFTMGGANGEPGPYSGGVSYSGANAAFVLVGESDASGEGDLNWAAVVLDRNFR